MMSRGKKSTEKAQGASRGFALILLCILERGMNLYIKRKNSVGKETEGGRERRGEGYGKREKGREERRGEGMRGKERR